MWAQLRKRWLRIALINFLLAAYIGMLMRYAFVEELAGFEYRNFLHTHTHVAILGWLFPALIVNILASVRPGVGSLTAHRLLLLIQFAVLGMVITYPMDGYWAGSIAFTVLHVLTSYVLCIILIRSINRHSRPLPSSFLMLKTALWFFLISTLTFWVMPFLMSGKYAGSALYYANLQFFLHFQINGWFIFAVLGLFFRLLEKKDIPVPKKDFRRFYVFLVAGSILTYALAVAWSNPAWYIYVINSIGVILQLVALYFFGKILRVSLRKAAPYFHFVPKALIGLAIACFVLKVLIQTAVVLPFIAEVAYTIRNFVIGFLHLILLGMITMFVLGTAVSRRDIKLDSTAARIGLSAFVMGFVATEFILFYQGTLIWAGIGFIEGYYGLIFGFTVLLPVGLLLLLLGQGGHKINQVNPDTL